MTNFCVKESCFTMKILSVSYVLWLNNVFRLASGDYVGLKTYLSDLLTV